MTKPKTKVKLPTDRTGRPIHVDDVLEWEDGTRLHVCVLEWYGDGFWCATDCDTNDYTNDYSDNLGASIVVGHVGKRGAR